MLDLIGGRPYVNLRRETQMYLAEFPYEHDFAQLKANPSLASYPTPRVNLAAATGRFWLRLPFLAARMVLSQARLAKVRKDFDRRLSDEIFPRFEQWAASERRKLFDGLRDDDLVERFREYHRRVMVDFVREALKATIVAGLAYANLKGLLGPHLGAEAAHYLAALASGERADVTVEMDEAIWRVGSGEKSLDEFLERFGHRGVGEFDLARPRWREDPQQVERLAHFSVRRGERSPAELYRNQKQRHEQTMAELGGKLRRVSGAVRDRIEREITVLGRYMPFRESVKHYWMMGYELLRLCLLELDRRWGLKGGIFYLTPDELARMGQVANLSYIIAERKHRREQLLRIPVPQVLFSDDLEAIGRPHEPAAGNVLEGVGVSEGVATGIARVLLEPTDLGEQESGYVLICPSTDPGWTPLFARARALVMERGGVLSHGAIVAREYGLPAVVNVPDATLRIKVGQHVRVDGDQGKVWLL
jgi:pyruvate,water dikinase